VDDVGSGRRETREERDDTSQVAQHLRWLEAQSSRDSKGCFAGVSYHDKLFAGAKVRRGWRDSFGAGLKGRGVGGWGWGLGLAGGSRGEGK
jgi:hypothetical protein